MRALALAAALTIGLAGCAAQQQVQPIPAQPAQAVFNPVGTYDFTADIEGVTTRGVLDIRHDETGALAGALTTDDTGEVLLRDFRMDGRRAEARTAVPQGDLSLRIEFLEGNRITGAWEVTPGQFASFTGQRRAPGE